MTILRVGAALCTAIALVIMLVISWPHSAPSGGGPIAARSAEVQALIDKCGVTGEVAAYFSMEPASSYRQYFPSMLLSPELDGVDDGFVVVYNGEVVGGTQGGVPGLQVRSRFTNALCVTLTNGDVIVYANVSRAGMSLPANAQIEVAPIE
jgi:hypothetical protein